jgi:hypothetical protein
MKRNYAFLQQPKKNICLQQWWDGVISRKSYFAFLSYLPKILLACVIPALDSVYSRIAVWLNDMGTAATTFSCRLEIYIH